MPSSRSIPLLLSGAIALTTAAPAVAAAPHVVRPGETLWSISAANNLTTRTVAAFNGLPENSNVVLGSTINVPTVAEGAAALASAGVAPASTTNVNGTATTATGGPAPLGSYKVRAGDSLIGLARTAGVPVSAIAQMNGLDPNGHLLTGTILKLPSGSPTPARADEPAPARTVIPNAEPHPTPVRLSAAQVQQIAAAHGVPPSIAAAIGWQESGFNNGMVSSANARGIMQVMPGTWDYIQQHLAAPPLDPSSAADNVRAGVLYLRRLLNMTGGDESQAIAGYYQGLGSVRSRGMFEDTKQYVANVQALRGRFGG